jgi:ribosomal protein S12 methylthiotransferase
MSVKAYIDTLGCFKNLEDSERAAGLIAERGVEICAEPSEADVIVVNTCGFVEDAKRESIDRIFELAAYNKKLIVTGCLPQKYGEELFRDMPEVDAFLGVNDYDRLADIIFEITGAAGCVKSPSLRGGEADEVIQSQIVNPNDAVTGLPRAYGARNDSKRRLEISGSAGIMTGPRTALSPRYSAFLKVAEGCDNRCSYCAIPSIRGPYRSVPMDILVREARQLADEGAKELNLIAQDISAYGSDITGDSAPTLAGLMENISIIDKIEWIRLLYCYEERITDELIQAIARNPKVCDYIDIPLQHINDGILKRMNRRRGREHIEKTLYNLRNAVPDIAVRTTFITGFPGETEADFEELYNFVEVQNFERLGVFAYSPEDGTPAADFDDQVPREIAEERRDALMRLQMDISLKNNRRLVGNTLKVLAEEREDEDLWSGRTEYDAPEIDNSVIFRSGAHAADITQGDFVKVKITEAMDYDLIGEIYVDME